jgi:hypothetical protein
MHSNASLNLYPWGWTTTATGNGPEMANMGAHIKATNAGGNGYTSCQPPACLYGVDGDSVDWAYGELGIAAITTEVGGSSFTPTYSTIDSSLWPTNRGALIYEAKIARTPYLLTHGPDTNNVLTNPVTVTQGTPSQLSATINFAWTGNSFSQNVGAAEYYIDTPPWAGGTPNAMTGNFTSPTVNVSATIDTSSLAPGQHVIFVRGRGVNNYLGLQTWGPVSAAFLNVTAPSVTPTPTNTATPTATSTPQATQLVAHVTLQGRGTQPDARQSVPITLTLHPQAGGSDVNYSGATDASGFFTVTGLLTGIYDYSVKNPQTLSNSGSGLSIGPGTTQAEMGTLREGDADGNNCVTAVDFNIVKNTFGRGNGDPGYDPRADFTGDNVISASDFTLLRNNFGTCGGPPVP